MNQFGLRKMLLALLFVLMSITVYAKSSVEGSIIAIENGKVYLDVTSPAVSKGDVVTVMDGSSAIASVEIEELFANYSQGKAVPSFTLGNIKSGMTVKLSKSKEGKPVKVVKTVEKKVETPSEETDIITDEDIEAALAELRSEEDVPEDKKVEEKTQLQPQTLPQPQKMVSNKEKVGVYVAPAQVNDVVGVGHFGGYVSDILMEQLLLCENVRLLDRSVLREQINEMDLAGEYIDPKTAVERGKIIGAKYVVKVTMQKPDVVNVSTGIPLASIMGALQGGLNKNIGAQYASNMEIATLHASVTITARVVDIETGEVMYQTSGSGKAKGKSQLSMEYGALGGMKLNGGADGFKQTVTGKAIQKAFIKIGRDLNKHFNGETTSKVMGTVSGYGNYSDKLEARGMSLYMGIDKLDDDAVRNLFYDNSEMYFKYKSAKKQRNLGTALIVGGVVFFGGGIALLFNVEDDEEYIGYCCMAGGVILSTIGVYTNKSASSKVKNLANEYNKKNSYAECRLDLVAPSTGGIGLRLTF